MNLLSARARFQFPVNQEVCSSWSLPAASEDVQEPGVNDSQTIFCLENLFFFSLNELL